MRISMRKVTTILKKDLMDYIKNPAMSVATLVPVIFVLLYKFMNIGVAPENKAAWLLNFGMLINATMSGILVIGTSIAEEKEKNTLRTLRMANVSTGDFFLGKLLGGMTITLGGGLLIFFLSGVSAANLLFYIPATLLGCASILMLSAWIGILSRDQMTCGVYQVPVMLLFMLPAVFGDMNGILNIIGKCTPIYSMLTFYSQLVYQGLTIKIIRPLAVMIVWIVIGAVLFAVSCRKQDMDN